MRNFLISVIVSSFDIFFYFFGIYKQKVFGMLYIHAKFVAWLGDNALTFRVMEDEK